MLAQRLDVQRDRFGDELLHFVAGMASRHAARKAGHIRAPGVAFLLDHNDVLSHHSAFPTCLPTARSIPAYPSVPRPTGSAFDDRASGTPIVATTTS